ncbi:heme-dependent oxidative N-demethylase family protein [Ancylobacter lacus]|uniref:heme-dependent oxidative N-demethylase family protein n=1 Tax=Ancylobacter lacus TaxID=2579970 RepID=UPI001FEB9E7E|nr:DUF3445 domain-containing protein [Ancylobacter lacus]
MTEPQTFRNALTFCNARETLLRFPFPFAADRYETAANLEQNDRTGPCAALRALFDVDAHYRAEIEEKAFVLARDPQRCTLLPHLDLAQWDVVELVMSSLARDFPQLFRLDRDGRRWRWRNAALGIDQSFRFGDPDSLPCPPFEYIARQTQGDMVLLAQRGDMLYLDGGMLTAAQGWSLPFDLGMSWREIHGEVTGEREQAAIERGLAFALRMQPETQVRRPNWVICVTPRLDNGLETAAEWAGLYEGAPPADLGRNLLLRVEVQQLYRLRRSHVILFAIRVYMARLSEIATVPKWAARLHRVLRDLDPAVARAKAVPFRDDLVAYLAPFDDGAPLAPGRAPF